MATKRERGRGERVLPGLWRLRLPLPWAPRVPHGNAWAIAAGSGFVLVDCGVHARGSLADLEQALEMVGLQLEQASLLVVTHAHHDHWGEAATVVERAGCELWMHPDVAHARAEVAEREPGLQRRLEHMRRAGIPDQLIADYAEDYRGSPMYVAGDVRADRPLVDGVRVQTDLGTWTTYETPGHAPSEVCLHLPGRRLLISGDHLLGRVALYFDYGYAEDPVGAFLTSLDRVAGLDSRLGLSGHGKPFVDVPGHIAASRRATAQRQTAVRAALDREPRSVAELLAPIWNSRPDVDSAWWLTSQTLAHLTHLEATGQAARQPDGAQVRWRAA